MNPERSKAIHVLEMNKGKTESRKTTQISHPLIPGYLPTNKQKGGMKLYNVCKEVDCFPRAVF